MYDTTRQNAAQVKSNARGRWRSILPALGIDASYLSGKHRPCPACGGKDRFRFIDRNGDGMFFCNRCGDRTRSGPGASDGFSLLMRVHEWTFAQALRNVSKIIGSDYTAAQSNAPQRLAGMPQDTPDWLAYRKILELWEAGCPVMPGDPAYRYISKQRRIPLDVFPSALRYLPGTESRKPALLAAFTNSSGELVQVQKVILTPDGRKVGAKKLFMPAWKRGAMNGGAIKLYEPTDTLAIGEGLETCLSAHLLLGLPVWATTGAFLLQVVEVPESVRKVVVIADNDLNCTGINSAKKLAARMVKQGRDVEILMTSKLGSDFNDLLQEVS
jgi:putative DNA primase/helicase